MKLNILVVDDDPGVRGTIKMLLEGEHKIFEAADDISMLSILAKAHMDVVLLDIRFERISGIDLIPKIQEIEPDAIITMISVENGHDTIIKCWRLGVFDYLVKPFVEADLADSIGRAQRQIEMRNVYHYNSWAETRVADEYRIIGDSLPMRDLFEKIEQSAKVGVNLLITGETGVGKEMVARAIHRKGPRSRTPFVAVNCGAIPPNLFESEFFGHERGAFTGADKEKKGMFEIANGGTLFLDEIGELNMDSQVKLLRAIDGGGYSRLGGTKLLHADVIIYAATNKDLKMLISEKTFREDLYYRLNVMELRVPPLRERREDIPMLIEHFIKKHCPRLRIPGKLIDGKAARYLQNNFEWQGNVRELENAVIKLLAVVSGENIDLEDVQQALLIQTPVNDFCQLVLQRANIIPLGRREIEALFREGNKELKELVSKVIAERLHEKFPGGIMNMERESGIERRFLSRILIRAGILPKKAKPE